MVTERRLPFRYQLDAPCEFSWETLAATPVSRTARTVNISLNGVLLSCDHESAELFMQQQAYPPEACISVELPERAGTVVAQARQVVHRRLSQNIFYLGLEFTGFEDGSKKVLSDYLMRIHG